MQQKSHKGCISQKGFTLIELLVVVLIIAILAAIALPQYQKAVLKSRYSGLMPIASAVANGQEIYYMDKGNYARNITELDIKAPSGGVNANIEVNDGTDERFEYVLATKDDLPGLAYVIYQKHSEQFPDTVMCEANEELNEKAPWLCKDALKGTEVTSGSLQGTGWTAYIIKGTEGSSAFTSCTGKKPEDIVASNSTARGVAVCDEDLGEYHYVWVQGHTYSNSSSEGADCEGDKEYACASATFEQNARCIGNSKESCINSIFSKNAKCNGRAEGSCDGSTFTDSSVCNAYVKESCSRSTFTDTTWCHGFEKDGCSNSTFTEGAACNGKVERSCADSDFTDNAYCLGKASGGCSGSTFTNGAKCSGESNRGCADATITDGGYCYGASEGGCSGAIIQDGGYCKGKGCDQAQYSGTGCCASGCRIRSGIPRCPTGVWDSRSYW